MKKLNLLYENVGFRRDSCHSNFDLKLKESIFSSETKLTGLLNKCKISSYCSPCDNQNWDAPEEEHGRCFSEDDLLSIPDDQIDNILNKNKQKFVMSKHQSRSIHRKSVNEAGLSEARRETWKKAREELRREVGGQQSCSTERKPLRTDRKSRSTEHKLPRDKQADRKPTNVRKMPERMKEKAVRLERKSLSTGRKSLNEPTSPNLRRNVFTTRAASAIRRQKPPEGGQKHVHKGDVVPFVQEKTLDLKPTKQASKKVENVISGGKGDSFAARKQTSSAKGLPAKNLNAYRKAISAREKLVPIRVQNCVVAENAKEKLFSEKGECKAIKQEAPCFSPKLSKLRDFSAAERQSFDAKGLPLMVKKLLYNSEKKGISARERSLPTQQDKGKKEVSTNNKQKAFSAREISKSTKQASLKVGQKIVNQKEQNYFNIKQDVSDARKESNIKEQVIPVKQIVSETKRKVISARQRNLCLNQKSKLEEKSIMKKEEPIFTERKTISARDKLIKQMTPRTRNTFSIVKEKSTDKESLKNKEKMIPMKPISPKLVRKFDDAKETSPTGKKLISTTEKEISKQNSQRKKRKFTKKKNKSLTTDKNAFSARGKPLAKQTSPKAKRKSIKPKKKSPFAKIKMVSSKEKHTTSKRTLIAPECMINKNSLHINLGSSTSESDLFKSDRESIESMDRILLMDFPNTEQNVHTAYEKYYSKRHLYEDYRKKSITINEKSFKLKQSNKSKESLLTDAIVKLATSTIDEVCHSAKERLLEIAEESITSSSSTSSDKKLISDDELMEEKKFLTKGLKSLSTGAILIRSDKNLHNLRQKSYSEGNIVMCDTIKKLQKSKKRELEYVKQDEGDSGTKTPTVGENYTKFLEFAMFWMEAVEIVHLSASILEDGVDAYAIGHRLTELKEINQELNNAESSTMIASNTVCPQVLNTLKSYCLIMHQKIFHLDDDFKANTSTHEQFCEVLKYISIYCKSMIQRKLPGVSVELIWTTDKTAESVLNLTKKKIMAVKQIIRVPSKLISKNQ